MLPNTYELLKSEDNLVFEFYSLGPKGRIKKIIKFTLTESENVYNLGFGDEDIESNEINDTSRSNINGIEMVLASVAKSVLIFLEFKPDAWVAAIGSTHSRTRLYQMGINSFLHEIVQHYEVFGFHGDNWEIFQKGKNYEAFLIKKK